MVVCEKLINFSLHRLCVDHTQHLDTQLSANGYCVIITECIILKLYMHIDHIIIYLMIYLILRYAMTYPLIYLLYLLNWPCITHWFSSVTFTSFPINEEQYYLWIFPSHVIGLQCHGFWYKLFMNEWDHERVHWKQHPSSGRWGRMDCNTFGKSSGHLEKVLLPALERDRICGHAGNSLVTNYPWK